jgi:hypothetical protein
VLATVRPPLVQGGARTGWVWSRGSTWSLGCWVRWAVTPTGTGAGSSAPPPPPHRRLAAGGAEAARVRLMGLRRSSSKYSIR